MPADQNFQNHTKLVPAFHLFALPVLMANVIWMIVIFIRHLSFFNGFEVLFALAVLLAVLNARLFALTVQDRVIRLEMRLRMMEVLPVDLRGRIPEFTAGQLIALRFAGDAELPELARKTLDDKISDKKAIKKMVRNWQPDHLRA